MLSTVLHGSKSTLWFCNDLLPRMLASRFTPLVLPHCKPHIEALLGCGEDASAFTEALVRLVEDLGVMCKLS